MSRIKLHPTTTASWQSLVLEAQDSSHITLTDDLQSYLVFLLMRFIDDANIHTKPIAIELLESLQQQGRMQQSTLRDVGDKCLLLSGFFPGLAERRLVTVSYFVGMGRNAYSVLSHLSKEASAQLYHDLSHGFVPLMDILQTIREMSSDKPLLDPLAAAALWEETESAHAHEIIAELTDATLFKGDAGKRH